MPLPKEFTERMKKLPGFDYERFIECFSCEPYRGLRVNTLKCSAKRFKTISPFQLLPVPFADEGFYIGKEVSGRHPYHHAGVFYLQEPSAMSAVTALDVRPGMKVLDLCAAPGGKSTQAAAKLSGSGFILCNEVISSRASALLGNIERCGIRNAAVTCEKTDRLCDRFKGYFDRVLVDAPCSGEGMFRRNPEAAKEWSIASTSACAKRQLSILEDAAAAVATDGLLVYSTCTFAPCENEGVVDAFLKRHKDFELEEIPRKFGSPARPEWTDAGLQLSIARRVFPFDGGEGHFVAGLRRTGDTCGPRVPAFSPGKAQPRDHSIFSEFFASQFSEKIYGNIYEKSGKIYILPGNMPDLSGINLLRAGVFAGEMKPKRFEPSHALYMAANSDLCVNPADFSTDGEEIYKFLHGEEIKAPGGCSKGFAAVRSGGFVTGFGKISNGVLKNHYPKGLRNF